MVYGKEPKSVYCDTVWKFSSESNSNISTSKARVNATPKTYRVKKYQLWIFDACKLNKFLTIIPASHCKTIGVIEEVISN